MGESASFRFSKQPPSHPFHVCTIVNRFRHHIDKFYLSCKQYGVDFKVLGLGREYPGNYIKLIWMLEYLQTLDDEDIAMFVDGFDVLILADPETIIDQFKSMDASIVMAAEKECYPFPELKEMYPASPTDFKYINTGTYIGYVGALKRWLTDLNVHDEYRSDQGQISVHYINYPEKGFLTLDYQCELFLPLYMVKREELVVEKETNRLYFLPTQTRPCVLHANSGTQEVLGIWKEVYREMIKRNFWQKVLMK